MKGICFDTLTTFSELLALTFFATDRTHLNVMELEKGDVVRDVVLLANGIVDC